MRSNSRQQHRYRRSTKFRFSKCHLCVSLFYCVCVRPSLLWVGISAFLLFFASATSIRSHKTAFDRQIFSAHIRPLNIRKCSQCNRKAHTFICRWPRSWRAHIPSNAIAGCVSSCSWLDFSCIRHALAIVISSYWCVYFPDFGWARMVGRDSFICLSGVSNSS